MDQQADPSEEMALAIGRMTMAWSRVHFSLYQLLFYVSGLDERAAQRIEFFRVWTDKHKRRVAEQALIGSLGPAHSLSLRLGTALKRCDDLAEKRNAFIHTPLFAIEGLDGIHPLGGMTPGEKWEGSRAGRYHVRPHALADCLELHLEIEQIENEIDDIIDEAIIARMAARATSA